VYQDKLALVAGRAVDRASSGPVRRRSFAIRGTVSLARLKRLFLTHHDGREAQARSKGAFRGSPRGKLATNGGGALVPPEGVIPENVATPLRTADRARPAGRQQGRAGRQRKYSGKVPAEQDRLSKTEDVDHRPSTKRQVTNRNLTSTPAGVRKHTSPRPMGPITYRAAAGKPRADWQ